jgi:hypothetical protein
MRTHNERSAVAMLNPYQIRIRSINPNHNNPTKRLIHGASMCLFI